MMKSLVLCSVITAAAAGDAAAQIVPGMFGFQVHGQNGSAGEFCWAFSCTPQPLSVSAGETLLLQVNAPHMAFYAIGASFSASRCLTLPGIANMLVLDPSIVTIALGTVAQPSPMLACWGGTQQVPLLLPAGLPAGLSFTAQALAEVPGFAPTDVLSFSTPVSLTVQ